MLEFDIIIGVLEIEVRTSTRTSAFKCPVLCPVPIYTFTCPYVFFVWVYTYSWRFRTHGNSIFIYLFIWWTDKLFSVLEPLCNRTNQHRRKNKHTKNPKIALFPFEFIFAKYSKDSVFENIEYPVLFKAFLMKILYQPYLMVSVFSKKQLSMKVSSTHFAMELKFYFNDFSHWPILRSAPCIFSSSFVGCSLKRMCTFLKFVSYFGYCIHFVFWYEFLLFIYSKIS